MVHREARLRDPRAPRSLDYGGTEDGEHRVPLVRGLLPDRAREQWDLVYDERCEARGSRRAEARRRVHHPDDEGGLGHLRDVQRPGRKRVLPDRGVAAIYLTCESRSRMNPAVRAARAMIEIIGFTPGAVGTRLPSPIQRSGTSCDSPVGFAAEVFGLAPPRAEPIGWAENRATPFSRIPRRPSRSMKASNSAPRIGELPSPTEHSRRCSDPIRSAPAAR